MSIHQLNFDGKDKVEVAIMRLQHYVPPEGYYVAFSGGKDSTVVYDLVKQSGVKHDVHYNVSPIDPPELIRFIRETYPEVNNDRHARGFWKRFLTEGPPMRQARWCCELIKEAGGIGRTKVLGTRRTESTSRRGYGVIDVCKNRNDTWRVQPIVDWTTPEIWEYIKESNLPYCSLYDEGFDRLGCVLCPFKGKRQTALEIERFPKIAANWRSAFDRYFNIRIERGTSLSWQTSEDYWQWWISRA